MQLRLQGLLIPLVGALLTSGCAAPSPSSSNAASSPQTVAAQSAQAPPAQAGAPAPRATYTAAPPVGDVAQYEKMQVVIETERGNIVLELYPREAPKSVASFVKLAQDGFYNGLTFHRVEPGFVIQGGDPVGTGEGGPGYTLPAEFNKRKHVRGTVAMARTADPNSAGSQFYICLGALPFLDNQYTVFGQVTSGLDIIDKVQVGDKMTKVRVEPKGTSAAKPAAAGAPASNASVAPAPASSASSAPTAPPSSEPAPTR